MIRKQRLLCNLILLCIAILLFSVGTASAAWWDSDWNAYSTITLNASAPQNNSQIHLSSDDFEIPLKMWVNMNQDGNDTRILSVDNSTVFPIWIEYLTSTNDFSIWVNITDNTTGTSLLWYYGNATVNSISDGDGVFTFFDDFDTLDFTNKWQSQNQGLYSVSNGFLELTNGAATYSNCLNSKNSFTDGYIIESRIKVVGSEPCELYVGSESSPATKTTQEQISIRISDLFYTYVGGVYSSSAVDPVSGVLYRVSLEVPISGAGNTRVFSDDLDTTLVTKTGTPTYTSGYIFLHQRPSNTGYLDWIFVRNYELINPVMTDIDLTVIVNTPPTQPTVVTPGNLTTVVTQGTTLNVSSSDIDGDQIIYYFYGDLVDGSTYLGVNNSVNGSAFNWSVVQYGNYYWKVQAYDGFNYSDYSDIFQFILVAPPNLTTPINTSTQYETYPPLTANVGFTWQDLGAPQYRLMIAEDISFNVVAADVHIGTNNDEQYLIVNKEYFWKVYSYDGTTYSDTSNIYRFNLTGNSTLTGSAIEGVVYQANGDISAIPGAEVTIWNTTWSSSMITGSNGYYVFEGLNDGTVYNLQAKSDRYWDSSIALVSAESDPVTNNFYLIDDLTDTEWWHYVEFTLQNVWGVTYPNVATNVYIGDSPTISESGNTESDGTISFHLNQNVQYHITFINSTLGINEDITLYPIATSYTVYIDSYSFDLPDTVTDDIRAYIVSSRINATYGYINFTWSDTSGLTTSINYYIHDVDGNELYSTNNSGPDMFNSQIVAATDDRYIARYVGVHPIHGIIDKTETVVFHGGRRVDFGWPHDWQYAVTALAFLIFMGALFGAKTAHYGAITVVIFAWIFKWIGWLNETNTSTLLIILAAVIAFGWSLRKSEEVKM